MTSAWTCARAARGWAGRAAARSRGPGAPSSAAAGLPLAVGGWPGRRVLGSGPPRSGASSTGRPAAGARRALRRRGRSAVPVAAAVGRARVRARCSGRGSGPCSGSRSRAAAAEPGGAGRCGRPGRGAPPATWRQLGYHLLALVGGPLGGALVAACWSAPVLAVAWFAGLWGDGPGVRRRTRRGRAVGGRCCSPRRGWRAAWPGPTTAAARVLLGPSRGEELALRVESLARSRAEIVAAADAERRRIERDLHDGAQQRLVSLAMNLGMARASLTDAPEPVRQVIDAGPRRGQAGPGRAARLRPRPAPGRARRPGPGRGAVRDRRPRAAAGAAARRRGAALLADASRPSPTSSCPRR